MKLKNFLLEIPSADWPVLRDMYVDNWPENYSTYFAIDNGIKLKHRDPIDYNKEVQMFSLNGDWSDGTFILLVSFCAQILVRFWFVYIFGSIFIFILISWCEIFKCFTKFKVFFKKHQKVKRKNAGGRNYRFFL